MLTWFCSSKHTFWLCRRQIRNICPPPKPARLRVALALITESSCTHWKLWEMPISACSCTTGHVWDPPSCFLCSSVTAWLGVRALSLHPQQWRCCCGRSCAACLLLGPWHFSWQSWTCLVLFNCFFIPLEKGLIKTQWYVCCLLVFC